MGRVYKRGKVWYIDFYLGPRRIRRRVGSSKKIAELALKDAEVKAARNEFGFSNSDIQIDKLLNQFLDYSKANHSQATYDRYRAAVDHFILFLKDYPDKVMLSQITAETVDQYKISRKNAWVNPNGSPVEDEDDIKVHTRKGARAKTINFELSVLRTMFNLAIKWGYLKENPTKNVVRLKVTDSKPPRFLSKAECQSLLENSPEDLRPIFFTFLHTGMRKGELENLEWSDVDFKRRKIRIRWKDFWQPKTGEREIPMSQQLYDLLRNLQEKNKKGISSSFVFPHKDGGRIKTKLRLQLIKISEIAGIEDLTRIHSLRHTFASHLVMSGVDLPTVQKLMGHADIQVTMMYSHLAADHLSEAVEKLDF